MADPRDRRGRNALALGVSLLASIAALLAAELGVRAARIQPLPWPSVDNILEFPSIRTDPLLGALPEPNWTGDWFGLFAAHIDARGFRGTGLAAPAAADARIVFLGDSCTFGFGVDTPETFVARLAAKLGDAGTPRAELLNAAYLGHSAVVGVYNQRERVLPLRPDMVVLGYAGNNAFRLSVSPDVERFRFFSLRKLLLRSRLFHIAAAWLAQASSPGVHPRDRALINLTPLSELHRVADPNEYAAAMRTMIADARAVGAQPVVLLLPRAATVSGQKGEDAATSNRVLRLPPRGEKPTPRETRLLELSCLDLHGLADPIATLHEHIADWRPVYPSDPVLRGALRKAAALFVAGDHAGASEGFSALAAEHPQEPLAHYDLGVSLLALGRTESGLAALAEADRLACNAFLHYQVVAWRLATELGVPVVDATLPFQAHDGEQLYVDSAHANAAGHHLIAEALWPVVNGALPHPSAP